MTLRDGTVSYILDCVFQKHVVVIRGGFASGKSTLASLCLQYLERNNQYHCTLIHGLIHMSQSQNLPLSIENLRSSNESNPSFVIIDEVQHLFHDQEKLWQTISSVLIQQTSPPLFFLLFCGPEDINRFPCKISFPTYLGSGLLNFSVEESVEVFDSFEASFLTIWSSSFAQSIPFHISNEYREYLLFVTEGHVGCIVAFLNTLRSPLFRQYISTATINSSSLDDILQKWLCSYPFLTLFSNRLGLCLSPLTRPETNFVTRLLERYFLSSQTPNLRVPNQTLQYSLIQRRIIRHSDEHFTRTKEASLGSDVNLLCPMIANLCFQSLYIPQGSNQLSVPDLLKSAFKQIDAMALQVSKNRLPYIFIQELYRTIVSQCPMEMYVSVHLFPQSCDFAGQHFAPIMNLVFFEDESTYAYELMVYRIQKMKPLPDVNYPHNENVSRHVLFLAFPTDSADGVHIPKRMKKDEYVAFVCEDMSGSDLVMQEGRKTKNNEIIFSGHISSLIDDDSAPIATSSSEDSVAFSPKENDLPGHELNIISSQTLAREVIKVPTQEKEEAPCKLLVDMLPDCIHDKKLKKLFMPYGKVLEAVIQRDRKGKSKCCGFVSLSSVSGAFLAIQHLNGHYIKNLSTKPLVVTIVPNLICRTPPQYFSTSKTGVMHLDSILGQKNKDLFIIRIPVTWKEEELERLFSPFGHVLSVTVYKEKTTQISKGFGFVSYDNSASARLAIKQMDGIWIQGKRLTVQLKRPNKVGINK